MKTKLTSREVLTLIECEALRDIAMGYSSVNSTVRSTVNAESDLDASIWHASSAKTTFVAYSILGPLFLITIATYLPKLVLGFAYLTSAIQLAIVLWWFYAEKSADNEPFAKSVNEFIDRFGLKQLITADDGIEKIRGWAASELRHNANLVKFEEEKSGNISYSADSARDEFKRSHTILRKFSLVEKEYNLYFQTEPKAEEKHIEKEKA